MTTHNLDATVFVYKHKATDEVKAFYTNDAFVVDKNSDYEHVATLEPRMFIQEHYAALERERQWVGLTVGDLAQIESDAFWQVGNHMAIALAVEDKLKEKNI